MAASKPDAVARAAGVEVWAESCWWVAADDVRPAKPAKRSAKIGCCLDSGRGEVAAWWWKLARAASNRMLRWSEGSARAATEGESCGEPVVGEEASRWVV